MAPGLVNFQIPGFQIGSGLVVGFAAGDFRPPRGARGRGESPGRVPPPPLDRFVGGMEIFPSYNQSKNCPPRGVRFWEPCRVVIPGREGG